MSIFRSLSGRLLFLTIVFVMLAEVLIFMPSLARFREDYLRERLEAANIVAIALLGDTLNDSALETKLLDSAQVRSIALKRAGARLPVLNGDPGEPVRRSYALDDASAVTLLWDALITLVAQREEDRVIRVTGAPDPERNPMGDMIEITMRESQLRQAMIAFGGRVAALSIIISLLSATLVFLSLNRWLVRPIRRLIAHMTAFREAPEAARIMAAPENGSTEIAEAERELAAMQTDLRAALRQKTRLAALGEAVAKINHDLRNTLATAQLLADRLERSKDPLVNRAAPKLLRSLDRATALCEHTLTYGKAEEPDPVRRRVMLRAAFEDARESLMPDEDGPIVIELDAPEGAYAEVDTDHLFRILTNLIRNAAQAIQASGKGSRIALAGRRIEGGAEIVVADDGPGLPVTARENLFKAFKGGVRKGGSGLGLAIAQELARGHGGEIALTESTTAGTSFRIWLPDSPEMGH